VKHFFTPLNPLSSQKGRRYRIVAMLALILVLILVALGIFQPLLPFPGNPRDTLLFYLLSSLNFIVSLTLLAVLIRNLLKLRQEQVENRLGSQFKTKMVGFSIGIALVPGILLFFFTYGLLNSSVDRWFGAPTLSFVDSAENIRTAFLQRELDDLRQTLRTLMRATGLRGKEPDITIDATDRTLLQREFINQQLHFLEITTRGQVSFSQGDGKIVATIIDEARNTVAKGRSYSRYLVENESNTVYLIVGVPIIQAAQSIGEVPITQTSQAIGGVFAVRRWPQYLADSFIEIAQQGKTRDLLSRQTQRLKVINLYLLGAVTLLLIFVATWVALYVARGITVPIQALAEATQALTQGTLDIRVECPAEDELAILVDSFNRMAAQLSENRRNLEGAAIEQKETNRVLEERRIYIETILESLSTGIISLDSEHNLKTINSAALKILRNNVELLFSSEDQPNIVRLLRRVKRIQRQIGREMELHIPDLLPVTVMITPLRDEHGLFAGSVVMIEDISELIQAQRSAVWSEVARRMAHEIKNPLTPIQLCAERIARNTQRLNPAPDARYQQIIAECTTTIKQEVATLARMVGEFSQFARLPQAQLVPAALNEVVIETVKLYADRLNGIALTTILASDLPLLPLDKEQMKRVLVNLIDNAVEAMASVPLPHQLEIYTEFLPEREQINLVVRDNGHGIARADRDKLFQPYFSTRKRGTGLGLAIVSHIIDDHGGKIHCEDNPPRGTHFVIELPTSHKGEG
jgi:nitrogen fixation/metabolism regulation signal transduction histidine kinase